MRGSRTRRLGISTLAGLAACSGPTPQERIESWAEAQDVVFADCGTSTCAPDDGETEAARQCIAEAELVCVPSRLLSVEPVRDVEVTATVFVLPIAFGCETHVFIDASELSNPQGPFHIRCEELVPTVECLEFRYCETLIDDPEVTGG